MVGEPKVEDLLATLRKAIETSETTSVSTQEQGTLTRGPLRELRVNYGGPPNPAIKAKLEDLDALKGRIARSNAQAGFTGAAPSFMPRKMAPHKTDRSEFAKILAGDIPLPPGRKPAPRPPSPIHHIENPNPPVFTVHAESEPPYLRRTHVAPRYEDEITYVPPSAVAPVRQEFTMPQPEVHEAYEDRQVHNEVPREEEIAYEEFDDGEYEPQAYDTYPEPPVYVPPTPSTSPPPTRARTQQRSQQSYRQPRTALVHVPQPPEQSSLNLEHMIESLLARGTGDRGLEDVTRELLRAPIRQWLEENLPALVERIIRDEIERVGRHGR